VRRAFLAELPASQQPLTAVVKAAKVPA